MATTNVNVTQIPAPRVPLLNAQTGAVSMEWFLWFNNIYTITGGGLAITPVINGGTGLGTIPTNGQLLIGNGTGYSLNTLTASTGITVTNGLGTITVTNSLPDLTVTLTGAGTTVVTGTYPNFTITSNDQYVGTVTSVAALTLGTTGTDLSSTVVNSTTTPVITLNVPTASATNRGALSSTDWTTFNNKQPAGTYVTSISVTSSNGLAGTVTSGATPAITLSTSITGILKGNGTAISSATSGTDYAPATSGTSILYGDGSGGFSNVTIGSGVSFAGGTLSATGSGGTVTSVTGTAPVVSSGGATPAISMAAATTSVNGYLTSTDWNTFNSKGSGSVTSVSVVSANGFAGTVATATTTPAITLTTSVTGLLKGNGTAISAAVANTDYVPLSTVLTKTADYTITGTDTWIINNKSGSAMTLTFPAASSWTGRYITVKNMQAQLVNSASSNVVPIDSTTAGTAILLGVVGNWATLVSDGTNWVIMQAASNNNLLLE